MNAVETERLFKASLMETPTVKKKKTQTGATRKAKPSADHRKAPGKEKARQATGTKEWATENVNFCHGCSNGCVYCYARYNSVTRFHRMSHDDWATETVRDHDVRKGRNRVDGRVMLPSMHDITPGTIDAAEIVLLKLLEAGNDVLIVSKPQLKCIQRLCASLRSHRDQILWRFSIGFIDERTQEFWEPNAPKYEERLDCLRMAHELGFETSASAEPLLEPWRAKEIVDSLRAFVTHSVWIGKLNGLRIRTKWLYPDGHPEIDRLEKWQANEKVSEVYETLKDDPLVRWKESYKKVLGLARPTTAGLDI